MEKPKFENAYSNFTIIGWYILKLDIIDILRNQSINITNKIQLAVAIGLQVVKNVVEAALLNGERFDLGRIDDYFEAIKYLIACQKSE
jgi:UTP--glucose-1-phosphate uridylyltransferase